VILHCNGDMSEMRAVAEAAGMMSEPAQRRADAARTARLAVEPIDIAAAEAELQAILKGRIYV